MDTIYTTELVSLGISLAELAFKGTATAISNKIKVLKDEKNSEKLRNSYDEIINELLSERDEAVRIAQSYKQELEKIVISDEDIQHLHNTVSRILEIVKAIQLANALTKGEEEVKKVELDIDANEDKETAKKAIRKRLFYNCREGICDKAFIYYCPICGVSTVENMNYCFGCGNKLEGNKSDQ